MLQFIIAIALLILGYIVYGAVVEKCFGIDKSRKTPCYELEDGIDYLPLPTWKVYLIQFLNIDGSGPVFGAILGILFGPAAYFWIVLGSIFAGGVHDYMSGMLSIRKHGASVPEIVGDELGNGMRQLLRVFSLVLLVLVGTVFATSPAGLLATMIGGDGPLSQSMVWALIIFVYYILATLLPIDKLIGKIYPIFGASLLIMAAGLCYGIFTKSGEIPSITTAFVSHHPDSTIPIFPGLCITIACGAISGFHSTQSPIMARCTKNEKYGRNIFYGAMITEGIVALIWATATIKFADTFDISHIKFVEGWNVDMTAPYGKLWAILTEGGQHGPNPAILINAICNSWLGTVGAILAVMGVIVSPISSGDTAFRSARLIAADFMKVKQNKIAKRLMLSIPLFGISFCLMFLDFGVLWRYFAWTNQALATFVLWTATVWLARHGRVYVIAVIPAIFMTVVSVSYILVAPEGFQISPAIGLPVGIVAAIAVTSLFFFKKGSLKADAD